MARATLEIAARAPQIRHSPRPMAEAAAEDQLFGSRIATPVSTTTQKPRRS
jgi:hypothetical protein